MKTNFLKSASVLAIVASISLGCVNDDNYQVPNVECIETTLVKTMEVADVPAPNVVAQYTDDDVIEAYVTSSDEGGNFFKSISFQTLDGSKGFSVPVDATSTYTFFNPGRKVLIKLKDKYTDKSNGSLRIGSLFINTSGEASVGRLSVFDYGKVLNRSCTSVDEDDLVRSMTISQAINDNNLNTLIDLVGVQFKDNALGENYYDPNNTAGSGTNYDLIDANLSVLAFRTSSFATFAGSPVPEGSGKIRGVLTKFGTTYQFLARTERDIQLTEERLDLDFNPPLGSSTLTYQGAFSENFESFATGSVTAPTVFPNYINDAFVGPKNWYVAFFAGNKYLTMSSFSSNTTFQDQNNKVYFIMPVDFTAANSFSFTSQDRFNNGGVLKVYTSTNYVPLGNISNATLTDITSNFNIASGTTTGTTTPFEPSGVYNFPATLTGNGFIIFEYTGGYSFSPARTTTMNIDNIVVN